MKKQTTLDIRELVIKYHKEGKTLREIGGVINRSHNTVKKIIDKKQKYGKLENRPKSGRPRRLNVAEIRSVVRSVKINPSESAIKLSKNISQTSGKPVSASTIRRALYANGLYGRVPRKKPHISKTNQIKRLNFAKKYQYNGVSF